MEVPPALPTLPPLDVQRIKDVENLRMLSIGYYCVGGFTALFSSFGLIHLFLGLLMLGGAFPGTPARPPHAFHDRRPAAVSAADAARPSEDADDVPAPPPPRPFSPDGETRRQAEPFSPDRDTRRPADVPFPRAFGLLFAILGGGIVLLGWTVGGLTVYAGYCLGRRRHRFFTQIMAGVNCLHVPFGTALGVCTFLVLQRPTVEALYQPSSPG